MRSLIVVSPVLSGRRRDQVVGGSVGDFVVILIGEIEQGVPVSEIKSGDTDEPARGRMRAAGRGLILVVDVFVVADNAGVWN